MTTPKKFRKKPVVIEAMQWDGTDESAESIIDWIVGNGRTARFHEAPFIAIDTLEGTMIAFPGDYTIRGVVDEFYPCRSDIFEQTYEEES